MGCLFCNIVEKKVPATVVYEDENTVAFRDIRPVAPTHVLIVPRKHIPGVRALSHEDEQTIGQLFVAARKVAHQEGLEANGYRLVVNDGDAAGQTVHHIHVHILGGRDLAWPPG
ncbi:Histidine triad (HIT) protein [Labilithrix luteola]|uniref:Histidine triad (HIT) protein n=1 Tax=Labilithrix luteola TaxID=1391654 RepID=A0A0K1Q5A9_9BACT|nr:histidine triad nucleotide-binding protein [Labilithrix luteola]AKV00904.1 Histidine triad (HIT) protein [Labilithrix luteola]